MPYDYITAYDSPNHWTQADLAGYAEISFETITIHWWGSPADNPQFLPTVEWLCRPAGNSSAHEVIEAGRVAQVINFGCAAWHSGNFRGNTTSYSLELNPRAWDSDYRTAAERIADIWATYGRKPLVPHNSWTATACPGNYDLARLDREAWDIYQATYGQSLDVPQPAPAAPAAPAVEPLAWVVDPGDTLGKIAAHYGTSVEAIAAHNGLANADVIHVGQVLAIPGPLVWIVDPGDTLGGIAAYYGCTVERLVALNALANADVIHVGQRLLVQP